MNSSFYQSPTHERDSKGKITSKICDFRGIFESVNKRLFASVRDAVIALTQK